MNTSEEWARFAEFLLKVSSEINISSKINRLIKEGKYEAARQLLETQIGQLISKIIINHT